MPLWRAVLQVARDAQIDGLASQVAFSAIFAIGPLLSLSFMLVSSVAAPAISHNLDHLLGLYAPAVTQAFIAGLTRRMLHQGHPALLVGSILGLLWSISSGTSAVLTALENIGCPTRVGFFHRRLRALALGVSAALGLVVGAVAVTLGPGVVAFLSRVFHIHLPALTVLSSAWVRLPMAGLSFAVVGALFFAFGTVRRPLLRAVIDGAGLTGLIAALVSAVLSAYLTFAPRLGGGYGAATSFFGVLLWLYVLGLATLLGATLTHVRDVRLRARSRAARRVPPSGHLRLPGRHRLLHDLRRAAVHRRRHPSLVLPPP